MSSKSASSRGHGHPHHDADIFYSSDSELGGGHKVTCSSLTSLNSKLTKSPNFNSIVSLIEYDKRSVEKRFHYTDACTNDLQVFYSTIFYDISELPTNVLAC